MFAHGLKFRNNYASDFRKNSPIRMAVQHDILRHAGPVRPVHWWEWGFEIIHSHCEKHYIILAVVVSLMNLGVLVFGKNVHNCNILLVNFSFDEYVISFSISSDHFTLKTICQILKWWPHIILESTCLEYLFSINWPFGDSFHDSVVFFLDAAEGWILF